MTPRAARAILCVLSAVYFPLYLFVLVVAVATSGEELIQSPGAWYAAVVPVLYVVIAGARAFGMAARRLPVAPIVALHVVALPALMYSFLGLGILLPVFALLWWRMERGATVALVE